MRKSWFLIVLCLFAVAWGCVSAQSSAAPQPLVIGSWELTLTYTHLTDKVTSGYYPNQTTFTAKPGYILLEIMMKVRPIDAPETITLKNTDLTFMVVDAAGSEWELIGTGMGFNNYCFLENCVSEYYFSNTQTGYVEYVFAVSSDMADPNYTLTLAPDVSLPFTVPFVASFDEQITSAVSPPVPMAGLQAITPDNAGQLTLLAEQTAFNNNVGMLVFNADSTQLVMTGCDLYVKNSCVDGLVRSWDLTTGQLTTHINMQGSIATSYPPMTLNADGSLLAGSDLEGNIHLWNALTGESLATTITPDESASTLLFSPDGTLLVTCNQDRLIRIWDAATGELQADLPGPCTSGIFSPDGAQLATFGGAPGTYGDGTINLWNISPAAAAITIAPEGEIAQSKYVFSPDNALLASGYPSSYNGDGLIHVWDAASGAERLVWPQSETSKAVMSLTFSPDSVLLVSAEENGLVHLWLAETGEEVAVIGQPETRTALMMTFNTAGTLLVVGRGGAVVQVWGVPGS